MLTLLLRLGPLLAGFGVYALFEWQWSAPLLFPWPLVAAVAVYALVAWRIAWVRKERWEMLGKTLPGCLFVFSAAVCALLLEETAWRHGLSLFVAIVAYFSLELFFLLKYDASRYPVNGLTHLQVGLVPLTNAMLAWGVVGIVTFSKTVLPVWVPIVVFMLVNAIGFWVTSHPDATRAQRRVWTLFGTWIGCALACLLLFLPLSMPTQAFLAALLIAAPLRLRRYGFSPRPSTATAWVEAIGFLLAFFALLLLSRWA